MINKKDLELIINDYITNFDTLITIINNYTEEKEEFFNSIVENIALIYLYIQKVNVDIKDGIDEDLFCCIKKMLLDRKEIIKPEYNLNDMSKINKQISLLKKIKQPEQRSPEWYIYRNNRLTASDLGTAINRNPYGNRKKLIAKKCGYEEKFITGQAITHGIKFEPTPSRNIMKK